MNARNLIKQAWPVAVIACLAGSTISANAQTVIGLPTISQITATSRVPLAVTKVAPLSDIRSALAKTDPLAQWGPIGVRPNLHYRLSYGDGLLLPGQPEPQSSTIHAITAGLLLELGKHFSLNYALTRVTASNPFMRDSTDHTASLNGGISHDNWTFAVSQFYQTNSPISVETGQQTRNDFYSTSGSASYQVGPRTLLDTRISYSSRLVDAPVETPQWTTADWFSWSNSNRLHYQISPRFDLAAGVELTFDRVINSSNMSAVQPHLLIKWQPTNKLSLTSQFGIERRRIDEGDVGDLRNPVYSASVQYQPLATTTLSFSASQSVSASYFANQASKGSNLGFNLSQRLLQRLFFSAGVNYGESTYIATSSTFIAGRNDKYTSYDAKLSTTLLRRGSVSIFFQRSRNSSNTIEFGFSSYQFGTELSYSF